MSARVLVVDDIPVNVRLLEAKLSAEYFDVVTAGSGAEALRVIADQPPDIILLAVMMPEMEGFEVYRRIQDNTATAHIHIVNTEWRRVGKECVVPCTLRGVR